MKRIDTTGRAPDLFGAGKDGFRDGNPLTATTPTQLNAAFFNMIQEEIAGAIELAGGLALDPANRHQLSDVLTALRKAAFIGGVAQSIPNNVLTTYTGQTTTLTNMPASGYNSGTGELTIGAGDEGAYLLIAENYGFTTGNFAYFMQVAVNGVGNMLYSALLSSSAYSPVGGPAAGVRALAPGDKLKLTTKQNSGGALSMTSTMTLIYLGK